MSYGLQGVCDTASSSSANADGDYRHHQRRPYNGHFVQPTRTSSYQSQPYSNGFENSYIYNGHSTFEDPQEQQLANDDDGEVYDDDEQGNASDRPRLLMWGLTKYVERTPLSIGIETGVFVCF